MLTKISSGVTIGLGYKFTSGSVFFTYNGARLSNAFSGVYVPRGKYDVYAAIGVEGQNEFEVNFGTDMFRWKEGNDWAWRVEGHGSLRVPQVVEEMNCPVIKRLSELYCALGNGDLDI